MNRTSGIFPWIKPKHREVASSGAVHSKGQPPIGILRDSPVDKSGVHTCESCKRKIATRMIVLWVSPTELIRYRFCLENCGCEAAAENYVIHQRDHPPEKSEPTMGETENPVSTGVVKTERPSFILDDDQDWR